MDRIQTQKSSAKKIKKKKKISQRVATVAGDIVSKKGYVSVIDLFLGIGWLTLDTVIDWKSGKIPYIERTIFISQVALTLGPDTCANEIIESLREPSYARRVGDWPK